MRHERHDALEQLLRGAWIDASRPLTPATPVWPGDRAIEVERRQEAGMTVGWLATTVHAGTHLDAPLHLDGDGASVDAIPLASLMGAADVVTVRPHGELVTRGSFPEGWRPSARRVLLRTDSYPLDAPIGPGFAGAAASVVEWLADDGVQLLGIDTPSMDRFDDQRLLAHRRLADRGVWWIEGLWLGGVAPGRYLMVALPLAVRGMDAAPLRVVLRAEVER